MILVVNFPIDRIVIIRENSSHLALIPGGMESLCSYLLPPFPGMVNFWLHVVVFLSWICSIGVHNTPFHYNTSSRSSFKAQYGGLGEGVRNHIKLCEFSWHIIIDDHVMFLKNKDFSWTINNTPPLFWGGTGLSRETAQRSHSRWSGNTADFSWKIARRLCPLRAGGKHELVRK